MGTLIEVVGSQPRLTAQAARTGVALEVIREHQRTVAYLCRLQLAPATPLSEHTAGFEALDFPTLVARTGRRGKSRAVYEAGRAELALVPGVWAMGLSARSAYLTVGPRGEAAVVTRAGAFRALGAVEALQALGLDDAAVALYAGDYDAAAVQWIESRA